MSGAKLRWGRRCRRALTLLTFHIVVAGSVPDLRSQDIWTAQLTEKIEAGGLFWGEGYFMSETNGFSYSIDIVDSFVGQLNAKLVNDVGEFSFELIDGEPRIYNGCSLFNNPFMPYPKRRIEACLSSIEVIHYTGTLELPQLIENDFRAGVSTLELLSTTGLRMDGLIEQETPPSLRIQLSGSTNVITWESDGICTVEATKSIGDPESWFVVTNIYNYGAANVVSHHATNSGLFYRLGWRRLD